jgi:ubiquinone/menaquinone biosynthesis C-methylase UbiE
MNTQEAYNQWASQYDTNHNKTRDLEAYALRSSLAEVPFVSCLEIGCGTGKNTTWLMQKAKHITAVDLSEEMLAIAGAKITSGQVVFKQADIIQPWTFADRLYDLVSFSLVLEHIDTHLFDHVFSEASRILATGGHIYIGELHPYKQINGSKARFDTAEGTRVVECFNHAVSDFVQIPKKYGLQLVDVNEHFDDNDRNTIPRILTVMLRKIG